MNNKHPWEEEYERCQMREIHEMNVNQTNEIYRLKKDKNKLKNQVLDLRKRLDDEKSKDKLDEGSASDTVSIINMRRLEGLRKKLEKETDTNKKLNILAKMSVIQSALVLLNSPDSDKSLISKLKKFTAGVTST
jgi:hypothetical protein